MSACSTIHPHLAPWYLLPTLADHQEQYLERAFQRNKNPHPSDLVIFAVEAGLTVTQVRKWFENRLALWRLSQGLPANGRYVYHQY